MEKSEREVKAGSAEGSLLFHTFKHLLLSRVLSRIITFVIRLLVARRLNPDEYALSAIQFHLLTTTILFISREGFRRGCLRSNARRGESEGEVYGKIITVAWITVPTGTVLSVAACYLVLWWQRLHISKDYSLAVWLHGLGVILEVLSEPLYILSQHMLLLKLRVVIEALATFAWSIGTYVLLVMGVGKGGGLVFAYAQVAFGACLLTGYWGYFIVHFHNSQKAVSLLPVWYFLVYLSPLLSTLSKIK